MIADRQRDNIGLLLRLRDRYGRVARGDKTVSVGRAAVIILSLCRVTERYAVCGNDHTACVICGKDRYLERGRPAGGDRRDSVGEGHACQGGSARIGDGIVFGLPHGIEVDIRVAERDFIAGLICVLCCRIFGIGRRPAEEGIALGLRDEPGDGDGAVLRAGQVVRPVQRAAVRRVIAHELHAAAADRGGAVLGPLGGQGDIRVDAIDDPLTVRAFRHRRSKRSSGLGYLPPSKREAIHCRLDRDGILRAVTGRRRHQTGCA